MGRGCPAGPGPRVSREAGNPERLVTDQLTDVGSKFTSCKNTRHTAIQALLTGAPASSLCYAGRRGGSAEAVRPRVAQSWLVETAQLRSALLRLGQEGRPGLQVVKRW